MFYKIYILSFYFISVPVRDYYYIRSFSINFHFTFWICTLHQLEMPNLTLIQVRLSVFWIFYQYFHIHLKLTSPYGLKGCLFKVNLFISLNPLKDSVSTHPLICHFTIRYGAVKDMWVKDVFCKKKLWIYGCFKFLYSQAFLAILSQCAYSRRISNIFENH